MDWQPPRIFRTRDEPVTTLQVLGERCSGTNYVEQLLARNLPGVPQTKPYVWKHGFVDRRVAAQPGLLTVIVYRHPLRWLQSLHARPRELSARMTGLPFPAFIRHEWIGAFSHEDGAEELSHADLHPLSRQPLANPMRLRAAKIGYLEEMAGMPGQVCFLRFEDANRAPRATLQAMAAGLGLTPGRFAPVATFKGAGAAAYVPRQQPPVSAEDLAFIARELDLGLEARIGYALGDIPRFDGLPAWDPRSLRSLARGVRRGSGGSGRPARG